MIPFLQNINIQLRHGKFAVFNNHQNIQNRIVAKSLIVFRSLVNQMTKIFTFSLLFLALYVSHPVLPIIVTYLKFNVEWMGIKTDCLSKKWMVVETFHKKFTNLIGCRNQLIPIFLAWSSSVLQAQRRKNKFITIFAEFLSAYFLLLFFYNNYSLTESLARAYFKLSNQVPAKNHPVFK